MAGSLKYNLKKFTLYNAIGSVGWVAVTMFTGYFFGQSYKFFFTYIKGFTYFLIFLAGAITLIYILKSMFGSAFVRSLLITDKMKEIGERLKGKLDEFLATDENEK